MPRRQAELREGGQLLGRKSAPAGGGGVGTAHVGDDRGVAGAKAGRGEKGRKMAL